MAVTRQQALGYHFGQRPGKIEVAPTKPCRTQGDLSLAYTPGVALPCLQIEKNPHDASKYTARGNLVAVVSNGTAVLGPGDIEALAGKPAKGGEGRPVQTVCGRRRIRSRSQQPRSRKCGQTVPVAGTYLGGVNLEDIKAPECFYIEETLRKTMKIPVFHDD